MNDEAESSRAPAQRHGGGERQRDELDDDPLDMNLDDPTTIPRENDFDDNDETDPDDAAEMEYRIQIKKERRLDAKRKRIGCLEQLLRELDGLVYLELITLYYLDCSFLWFTIRAIIHGSLLTPLPEMGLTRQHDEHKPYLPMILFPFAVNFLLHLLYAAPSAGEETRGYLHGGLMIDFIGQEGPTSKWKLAALDIAILLLQMVMLAVHVKRRDLKKKLSHISASEPTTTTSATEPTPDTTTTTTSTTTTPHHHHTQDADAEERGILRRTDTLSDMESSPPSSPSSSSFLPTFSSSTSEPPRHHVDALDMLTSGQTIVADFSLIDTLLQSHTDYNIYRQTRAEASSSSSSTAATAGSGGGVPSNTLRQLQAIRMRIGVGGAGP
ncbi:DUF1746-domain-containing protein [Periconia macrospinosa]|uniref:DUF1746-domain-containing protein n=1 Tax=Periconia macrospinosa TaxID=97972 RepID=A0A2V1DR52_9PLEO|nr:DUF1746-domain-containing protein [Periconia macrospinosa]